MNPSVAQSTVIGSLAWSKNSARPKEEVSFDKHGRSTFLNAVKEMVDGTTGPAAGDEPHQSAEDPGSGAGGHERPAVPDQPPDAETSSESTPKSPDDGSGRRPIGPADRPMAAPAIEEAVAGVLVHHLT